MSSELCHSATRNVQDSLFCEAERTQPPLQQQTANAFPIPIHLEDQIWIIAIQQ